MIETYTRFDAAEFLESEEDIAGFLADSAESGDPAVLITALAAVARARNMSEVAKHSALTRKGLYRALAPDGNPSFANVGRIAQSMGFQLTLVPRPVQEKKTARVTMKRSRVSTSTKKGLPKATRRRSALAAP